MALLAIKPPYTMRERWEAVYRYWRTWQRCLQPGQTPEQMAADTLRMAFQAAFPRIMRPAFGPGLAAAAAAPAGWWVVAGKTCVAAYQPIGAGSLPLSYVNLANPGTYDAAPGVAPTWASATGWGFNGATQYLMTGVVPTNDQTWSMLIRFSGINSSPSGTQWIAGCLSAAGFMITPLWAGFNQIARYFSGGVLNSAAGLTNGVIGIAGNTGYKNGIADSGTIPSGAGDLGELYIGAYNNAGSPASYCESSIQAVAIYSDTLTAGEVATKSAAMAALTG